MFMAETHMEVWYFNYSGLLFLITKVLKTREREIIKKGQSGGKIVQENNLEIICIELQNKE